MAIGFELPHAPGVGGEPLSPTRYTGASMYPALKPGDRLHVTPYDGRRIRRGDVVVFHTEEDNQNVVHRVVAIEPDGVRTWGDYNCNADSRRVKPSEIIGHVVYAQRGKRRARVYGGVLGRMLGWMTRSRLAVKRWVEVLLRPAYWRLAESGIVRRCFAAWFGTRVVTFRRRSGVEYQLLLGGRVIGRCLAGEDRWKIRPPFRLFVDETALPLRTPDQLGGQGSSVR